MINHQVWMALAFSSFVLSCSDANVETEVDAESTLGALGNQVFVEARSYLSEPEDIDGWYALMIQLRSDFDSVCGDTFCEGDFSNYESLGFRCSVEQTAGTLERCIWIFAASTDEIVPRNGSIKVQAQTWRCRMPVVPGTPIRDFIRTLSDSTAAPIHTPLPGAEKSLYEGLTECL